MKKWQEARRSETSQAAPFSKGKTEAIFKIPEHKFGIEHGHDGLRMRSTAAPDRAPNPRLVKHCTNYRNGVIRERVDDQYKTNLPLRGLTVKVLQW